MHVGIVHIQRHDCTPCTLGSSDGIMENGGQPGFKTPCTCAAQHVHGRVGQKSVEFSERTNTT